MILEELLQSDSVFLDLSLQFENQLLIFSFAREDVNFANILGLFSLVHFILACLEWIGIIDEIHVTDFVLVSAIDLNDCLDFLIRHGEAEVCKGLSELLGRHLEVFVAVPILEEALGVKSVSLEPFFESINDSLGK